ncbi:hypothetical protein GCM10010441_23780 [Kitasatospora paracochleata]|uniref:Uncharacterized protein n=1 Tax=Kitasatospora paracochleata TaxID=58354 RepID=A0ABT1J029_9ACTN|nr:hypothetical protein [Kitasatospora paracochleata]MCP2310151.1 hypothetical protein [Kitasatospora paracochleata]
MHEHRAQPFAWYAVAPGWADDEDLVRPAPRSGLLSARMGLPREVPGVDSVVPFARVAVGVVGEGVPSQRSTSITLVDAVAGGRAEWPAAGFAGRVGGLGTGSDGVAVLMQLVQTC